jgi:uncharacterized phage protein (TIGR01671 family)
MREIKFRVWDKCRKKYNEDSYEKNELISVALGFNSDVCVSKNDLILQQYTGLLDKNGKEIYEGDILQPTLHDKCISDVVYNEGSFRIHYNHATIMDKDELVKIPDRNCFYFLKDHCNLSIIMGNIFENSDLLK